jgi:hypothetical protein
MIGIAPGMSVRGRHVAARSLGDHMATGIEGSVAVGVEASVMIEKFAGTFRTSWSEFLDLNHTSNPMMLVSLWFPKFAPGASIAIGRTSESGH